MEITQEESFGIIPLKQEGKEWSFFLILHKNGNHWGFPKGKREVEETPLESAARELFEETGLKIERLLTDVPIFEKYIFSRKGKQVEKSVTYFPALVSGEVLLQEQEVREGGWFPYEQALKRLTFQEARNLCKQLYTQIT